MNEKISVRRKHTNSPGTAFHLLIINCEGIKGDSGTAILPAAHEAVLLNLPVQIQIAEGRFRTGSKDYPRQNDPSHPGFPRLREYSRERPSRFPF